MPITLTNKEIAAKVGISPATLYRWKNDEGFQGLVSEAAQFYFRRACQIGAGFRNRRIIDICNLYDRIYQVIKERAEDPSRAGVPGGSTGLIAITRSGSLAGPIVSDEYDTALYGTSGKSRA